jgi:cell division protein FtsZ
MELGGGALMSIGQAAGEHKAVNAVKQALYHPLLEDISLANASGLIVNFTSGNDLTLNDIGQALGYLQEQIPPDAELIFGTTQNDSFQGQVQVNLIITGLGAATFDDVFNSFTRETSAGPERVVSQAAYQDPDAQPELVEVPAKPGPAIPWTYLRSCAAGLMPIFPSGVEVGRVINRES